MRFTFAKHEKLTGKMEIDSLFQTGQSFSQHPLRVIFMNSTVRQDNDIQVLISVPKKRFKRAVVRNRIKRLIRESYRTHKDILAANSIISSKPLNIAFIYIGDKDDITFKEIDKCLPMALERLARSF